MTRAFDTPIVINDHSIDRVLMTGLPIVFVFLEGEAAPPLAQAMKQPQKLVTF